MELNKNDAGLMDEYLNLVVGCKKGYRYSHSYFMKELRISSKRQVYLINKIIEYSDSVETIISPVKSKLQPYVDPIDGVTDRFLDEGGFLGVIEKHEDKNKEIDERRTKEDELLSKQINKITKELKYYRLFKLLAILGFVISLVGLFI